MAMPCCFRFALSVGRVVPRRNTLKICERRWHLTWRQMISQRNSPLQTRRPPLVPVGDKCLRTTPCRQMSSVMTDAELKKSVEALSEKFTEAMVHLEDAGDNIYFWNTQKGFSGRREFLLPLFSRRGRRRDKRRHYLPRFLDGHYKRGVSDIHQRHSAGTVYFSEDAKEAEEIVQDTLNDFRELLSGLDDKQQLWVKRTIGLKMEELKAQLQMLQDLARE